MNKDANQKKARATTRMLRSRRLTQREKFLNLIADQKPHSTKELLRRVGHRFSSTKFALVREGYVIEKYPHPTRSRQWLYVLVDVPRDE